MRAKQSEPLSSYTLKRCGKSSAMKRGTAILLVVLFILSTGNPIGQLEHGDSQPQHVTAKATGVDITVTNTSFSYTTSVDEGKYRMFSSNHPIPAFNRPAELYVIDAVVNIPIYAEVTLENLGSNPSGTIDVTLMVLHNEYLQFEMVNITQQMAGLSGGASNSIGFTFTPTYSGNHSMQVIGTSSIVDDVPANNQRNRHFTVASHYFNCNDFSQWTATNDWGINTDTALSQGTACHAGNGETSSYLPSTISVLETPAMDMSDAVGNPLRTNGMTFFYTGSSQPGDEMKVYIQDNAGTNTELATLSGTIDQMFLDGASWQTFSVNSKGATSPLIPAPQSAFSTATKFRFVLTTDATINDIGFWLDDIVIVYDQKVKPMEYALSSAGVATMGSLPDEWGTVSVSITNDGNISDYVLPSILDIPEDWEVYFSHPSGVSINAQTGILLGPGESKSIDVKIKPDENATTGFEQMTFVGTSSQYQFVNTTLPVQYQVLPDREPLIVQPELRPACPPGYTCPFEIEVRNIGDATDVFDLSLDRMGLPEQWMVQLSWTQSESILVRPDTPVAVGLTMTVPSTATPDTVVSFTMVAQSQNNSAKSHSSVIDIAASMISEAEVGMTQSQAAKEWMVDAGETKIVEFTIWNNASRQDIFSMEIIHDPSSLWTIEQPTRPDAVINPGATTTFTTRITAPETGQAGDAAPSLTPQITSLRSGMTIAGEEFDSIIVRTISDLSLELLESPAKLRPGTANRIHLELVNNGNGPIEATIEPMDIPDAWGTWITVDGKNHTEALALSAPYDLENNATVELWVYVPSEEAASEIHTITIMATNTLGLNDVSPEDNVVSFDTITASVKIPYLQGADESTSAMVGGTVSVESTLTNVGNAADDQIIVMASVSASPPIPNLVAFFSTGLSSSSKSLDEAVTIMLLPNQSTMLTVDLILPDDMILNTRIVVTFQVIAGMNAEQQPYELELESLVVVDQQRKVMADLSAPVDMIHQTGTGVPLFINMTSQSSQKESIQFIAEVPEGWQLVCNGVLMDKSGQNLSFTTGHITPQLMDVPCTLHRMNGPLDGKITFIVASQDEQITWQGSQVYQFEEREPDQSSVSVEVVAGGIAVLLAFTLLMVLLLRSRNSDEIEITSDSEPHEAPVPAGPPASSGPPVSTQHSSFSDSATEPPTELLSPPLPQEGLPTGWTMEQWTHYGQQYLDRIQGQP